MGTSKNHINDKTKANEIRFINSWKKDLINIFKYQKRYVLFE